MAATEQYKQLLEDHLPLINKGACEAMNNAREFNYAKIRGKCIFLHLICNLSGIY